MRIRRLKALCSLLLLSAILSFGVQANFEADNVKVLRIVSPNSGGHLYVEIDKNNNCPGTVHPYFIIPDWNSTEEPGATKRQVMLSMVMTALATGKSVNAVGVSCYLDNYLLADTVSIME